MVKQDLPFRGILRNEAREMTACSTHPECPSFHDLMLPIPGVMEVHELDRDVRVKGVLNKTAQPE